MQREKIEEKYCTLLLVKYTVFIITLHNWFLKNDLIINTTKTDAMSFHLCHSKPPFKPRTYYEIRKLIICLKQNCEIHEHSTRSKYDLHTQSRNTSLLQRIVLHMGVRLYKRLPLKIKKLDNFN